MNRPIKFRGKSIFDEGWLYGDLVHSSDMMRYAILVNDKNCYDECEVIPSTIGQFTGLYDKNGKEIYEGDTIEVISRNRVQSVRVEWDNTMYGFCAYNVDKSANRPLGWFTQNATSIRIVAVPATLPNLSKKSNS